MLDTTACPTCGSARIRKVRGTVKGARRGRAYHAADVVFYECPECGERLYDHEAMQKIEAARAKSGQIKKGSKRTRSRARAKVSA